MKEEEILGILPLHIRTIIKQADINWDELQEIRLRIQKPVILKYNAKTCYLSEQGKITTRKEQLHIVTSQEIRQAMEYISSYSMYAYIEQLKQGFLTIRGGHRVGICGTVVMDMGDILKAYQQADILVLATPVYFYGISAQMKTFIDRTYPIWQNLGHKNVYYIISAGLGEDIINRSLGDLDGFVEHLDDSKVKGRIYATNVMDAGLVKEQEDLLERAYEMGKSIFNVSANL